MTTGAEGEPLMVLFADGPPKDWRAAAAALSSAVPGFSAADAGRVCRTASGFLDLVLPAERLHQVARALTDAGFRTLVAPASQRVEPPPAIALMKLRLEADALIPDGTSASSPPLPWSEVGFLYAARVTPTPLGGGNAMSGVTAAGATVFAASQAVGGPPVGSAIARGLRDADAAGAAAKSAAPDVWLDVLSASGARRLRIRMGSFTYDCLPPPLAPIARVNFAKLVAALRARASNARCVGLVDKAAAGTLRLDQEPAILEHDFDRTVAFLLTRTRLGA